jgi:predicted Fe-Mo cluster-binding NifX family protein
MRVGFAVEVDEGLESIVYGHFGSAPAFIIVDTESKQVLGLANRNMHHEHGSCSPITTLEGNSVDAMVVGGIGRGALIKLNAMGARVYGAGAVTVKGNLALLQDNKLQELSISDACKAHRG